MNGMVFVLENHFVQICKRQIQVHLYTSDRHFVGMVPSWSGVK